MYIYIYIYIYIVCVGVCMFAFICSKKVGCLACVQWSHILLTSFYKPHLETAFPNQHARSPAARHDCHLQHKIKNEARNVCCSCSGFRVGVQGSGFRIGSRGGGVQLPCTHPKKTIDLRSKIRIGYYPNSRSPGPPGHVYMRVDERSRREWLNTIAWADRRIHSAQLMWAYEPHLETV